MRQGRLHWLFGVSLYRCVYVSSARLASRHQALQVAQIVDHAVTANTASKITGALMFDGTRFAQLLEGPSLAVIALAERIRCDKRHDEVVFLEHLIADRRLFERFSMAYSGNSLFVERTIALPLVKHERRSKYALRELINLMKEFAH